MRNIVSLILLFCVSARAAVYMTPFTTNNTTVIAQTNLPVSLQSSNFVGTFTGDATGLTNAVQSTNTHVLIVDSAANDALGLVGVRPFSNITNAFKLVSGSANWKVILRGSFNIPCFGFPGGSAGRANLDLHDITNVTVQGEGATLNFTGAGAGLSLSNFQNLAISGVKFLGDRSELTTGLSGAIQFAGKNTCFRFYDNVVSNWFDQGLTLYADGAFGTSLAWIKNNEFYNIGTTNSTWVSGVGDGTCMSGFIGRDWTVSDNYASNCFRFFEFENGGAAASGVYPNFRLQNNTLVDMYDFAFFFYPYNGAIPRNVIISGNCMAWNSPSTGSSASTYAIRFGGGTNIIVANNTFRNFNGCIVGADIGYTDVTKYGTNGLDKLLVANNIITGTNGIAALQLNTTLGASNTIWAVDFIGNDIEGSREGVTGGSQSLLIENNTFRRCLTADNSALIDICHLSAGGVGGTAIGRATNVVVRGNRCFDQVNTSGEYFIYQRGTIGISSLVIEDNDIRPQTMQLFGPGDTVTPTNVFTRHRGVYAPNSNQGGCASPGSIWTDTVGGKLYVKESGATNYASGWTQK